MSLPELSLGLESNLGSGRYILVVSSRCDKCKSILSDSRALALLELFQVELATEDVSLLVGADLLDISILNRETALKTPVLIKPDFEIVPIESVEDLAFALGLRLDVLRLLVKTKSRKSKAEKKDMVESSKEGRNRQGKRNRFVEEKSMKRAVKAVEGSDCGSVCVESLSL